MMSRLERYQVQSKPFFWKGVLIFTLLCASLLIAAHLYLKSQIRIEAPQVDLGRKVIIQLQNGKEIQTYENLLIEKEGKLYYEGEWNTINITGGIVVYQNWE